MPKYYNRVHLIKNTEEHWVSINPVLLDGEVILSVMETGDVRIKVGDGKTHYSELNFITSGDAGISDELRELVDSINADVNNVKSLVSGNTQSINEANASIEETRLLVSDNESSIAKVKTDLDTTKETVNSLSETVTDINSKVSENSTSISNLNTQFEPVKTQADRASTLANTVRVEVNKLTETVNSNNLYVEEVRTEVSGIRTDVDTNIESISTIQQTVSTLNTTVGYHTKSIDEISTNVAELDTKIETVSSDIKTNANDIKVLNDRVNNIITSGPGTGEDGEANINITEVVDIRRGYDGTIYPTAGDAVRALGTELSLFKELPISADDLGLIRDDATGLVHPTYKGIKSVNGIPLSQGGGGVGDASTLFRLRSTTESLAFSVSYGDKVTVSYTFSSLDPYDGTPTGNGTAFYYINSNLVHTTSIPQGASSFECSKYLVEGANEVTVTVKNADGDEKSLTWNINCIQIRLTSIFDYTQPSTDGKVTFKYTAYGDAAKSMHFILDGVEDPEVPVITSTGKQNTKMFYDLTHGLHTLEVYAIAIINDTEIKSNVLKYDIIVHIEPAVEPIISINYNESELLQGELVDIPYIVYDPLSTESNADLDIHYLDGEDWKLYKTETRTIDRSLQHWSTRYYPLGTVRFTVRLREVSRSITVNVDEYDLPIEPTTNDLELHLSSANRSNSELNPAVWEYNGITTEFHNVNWASSGWLPDENGDTCLHLTGGSTATIKFKPFAEDILRYGKTLEFEFAVRDVNNRDANVISCMAGGIGINITADTATLYSSLASVNCRFNDERRIRITFTIEGRSEYRMMSAYLDGVLTSCKQFTIEDDFQQVNPEAVEITIGSPYCSVDLYTVRSYTTALTQNDVINNYICDIADITTKAELFDRNNLYDNSMNLDYSKVKKMIHVMTITGSLPQSKGDKKEVTVTYEDCNDNSMNYTDLPCTIDVQGTSSQWYVRKNYKLKFKEKLELVKGAIPTKVFCMKADYAEATSTHNTQNANMIHTLYSDKTPAQVNDSRCRTTIQGFPCVIYHKETIDSTPTFLGKYNYNFDKGSEEAFGFTDAYDVESWEFCNNTSDACNFLGPIPADYSLIEEKDGQKLELGWKNDFERRYPDHDYIDEGPEVPNEAIARFKAMHDWVVSTIDYDFDDKSIVRIDNVVDEDGNPVYEVDSDGNQILGEDGLPIQKTVGRDILYVYREEFQNRFNLHKTLIYYVWTFFFLMVDQRAKNMFLTYWGATGKWEPWFYDNDTCLGINNEGQMVFDYYHEDTDLINGTNKVYNGQDSTLWNKFRVAFAAEIQKTYQELRSSNKLSYETIRNQFVNEGSDKWSETIYNEDSDYKYISMLREKGDATNLPQVKGTGEHHLEYFLNGRINYCDSKWYATGHKEDTDPGYVNDFIVLRVNTPEVTSSVKPNANITITPFSDMYAGVRYRANGSLQQQRLKKNESYTFVSPADNFTDTETSIYGASQVSSIGDLSPLYCNYVDVSKASKLIELKVGSEDSNYESPLTHLSLGTNRLLKKLDIRNCKKLTEPVDLTGCFGIEEVYAEGSSISSLSLADSGYLKTVHLPSTIVNLTIKNQKYIKEFTMEGYESIKKLHIENSPNLPLTEILLNTPVLERTRLINVEWETDEAGLSATYQKLLKCGGIDETGANSSKAVVSGIVKVPSIDREFLAKINEDFPELMVSVNGVILCTVSYYNWDGELIYVTTVERGTNAPDIVAEGIKPTPVKPQTDTHKYEFRGWSDSLENIQRSKSFVAMFDVFYAVKFMSDTTELYKEYVKEGTAVEDPITSGKIEIPQKESTAQYHYTYECWDIDFSNIKDVTYVYAIFVPELRSYSIYFYNETELLETKVLDYGTEIKYTGTKPVKLNVEYPQDYTFLGWSPELGTVEGETSFLAVFSESDHILDDWATVSANVSNGTYKDKYPIGILQRVILTSEDGSTEEVDVELVGYDHDTAEDGSTIGLTFITKNILKNKYMMSDSQTMNRAGWIDSDMREYLINDIQTKLSSDLFDYIVPVVKTTSIGGGNNDASKMVDTVDTLWTPALVEMVERTEEVFAAEGSTYELFKNNGDPSMAEKRRIKNDEYGPQRYWLRTPAPMSVPEYYMINNIGVSTSLYASYSNYGVVFGFCIGKINSK